MRFSKKAFMAICSFVSRRLKVLAYHGVTSGKPNMYDVSKEQFREQMFLLKENRYRVLPLCRAIDRLYNGSLEKKSVILTFDDAHESIMDNAVPCLLELGFPASVFVPTGRADKIGECGRREERHPTLDWDQLSELYRRGIDIHSHSVSHVDLAALNLRQLEYELRHSLEMLRSRFGDGDYYLAYPFGMQNQDVSDMARSVGYKGAFGFGATLSNWWRTDRYQLRRVAVLSTTTIGEFKRKINSLYDPIRFLGVHSGRQVKRLFMK